MTSELNCALKISVFAHAENGMTAFLRKMKWFLFLFKMCFSLKSLRFNFLVGKGETALISERFIIYEVCTLSSNSPQT